MNEKDPHRYDDIISLPRFVSKNRRHMSNLERAAQFSPFAALTGYEDAIGETGRMTQSRIFLSENEMSELDRRFRIIEEHIREMPVIILRYFEPDLYKEGGSYREETVTVKKIDLNERILVSENKKKYDLDHIVSAEGSLFDLYDFQ